MEVSAARLVEAVVSPARPAVMALILKTSNELDPLDDYRFHPGLDRRFVAQHKRRA